MYPIYCIIPLRRLAKRLLLCVEFREHKIHLRRINLSSYNCYLGMCMATTSCFHYWWSNQIESDIDKMVVTALYISMSEPNWTAIPRDGNFLFRLGFTTSFAACSFTF